MKLTPLALPILFARPGCAATTDREGKYEKGGVDCRLMLNKGLRECQGDDPSGLIVGGVEVPIDTYPWFVSLGGGCCGGTLISRQYVLTAAHCLGCTGVGTTARIGAFNLDAESESVNGGQVMQLLTVKEIVGHPKYNACTFDFDFALLKLAGPATAAPVRLDGANVVADYTDAKTHLFPIGFGVTSFGGSKPDVLRHVDVDFVPQEKCSEMYGSGSITDAMMCAADVGQDSCQGDSGGPLWDRVNEVQVGVVSWGEGCAQQEYPGVYSRISTVFPWIRKKVCDGTDAVVDDPFCACLGAQVRVDVDVMTDEYPEDTSWQLTDNCQVGMPVVFERESYSEGFTNYTNTQCVTPSAFTFNIRDDYGDGLCCEWGEGGYQVTYDVDVVAAGREFAYSKEHTFGDCGAPTVVPPTPQPSPATCVAKEEKFAFPACCELNKKNCRSEIFCKWVNQDKECRHKCDVGKIKNCDKPRHKREKMCALY